MKNAENIMFKIGKIINIVLIPLSVILFIVGIIFTIIYGLVYTEAVSTGTAEDQAYAIALVSYGATMIVWGIYTLIFSIVSLVICKKKKSEIDNGSNEVAPRVFLIVFGAIGENPFYVLSGIFSLVARSQEAQKRVEESE